MTNPTKDLIEARRLMVAAGLVAKKTTRELSQELGVSHVTIAKDRKIMLRRLAEAAGDLEDVVNQALLEHDIWQRHVVAMMPAMTPREQLAAIDVLLKIQDARLKLKSAWPIKGLDDGVPAPTGPPQVTIIEIPAGNTRGLITEPEPEPDDEELVDWVVKSEGQNPLTATRRERSWGEDETP